MARTAPESADPRFPALAGDTWRLKWIDETWTLERGRLFGHNLPNWRNVIIALLVAFGGTLLAGFVLLSGPLFLQAVAPGLCLCVIGVVGAIHEARRCVLYLRAETAYHRRRCAACSPRQ